MWPVFQDIITSLIFNIRIFYGQIFLINLEIINKGDIMAKRIIHQADLRAIENNLRSIHEGLRTIGFHT